jgi:hypothetical protein
VFLGKGFICFPVKPNSPFIYKVGSYDDAEDQVMKTSQPKLKSNKHYQNTNSLWRLLLGNQINVPRSQLLNRINFDDEIIDNRDIRGFEALGRK